MPQDNNPAATQAANASFAAANPGIFGGSSSGSSGSSSGSGLPGTYVSDSSSGANPTALAQGVKEGTVNGTLDASGNYIPPSTTAAQLQATGTVAGTTPAANTSTGDNSGGTSTGLQMPTGDAAQGVFDPASGQQINPSQAGYKALIASKTPPPQDSASGVSGATAATTAATPPPTPKTPPAVANFLQSETVQQQADALMQQFMPQSTTDELNNQIATVNTDKTILAGLNTQLMNINTVMAGTQNDLRSEITAAGGFATESQIDALAVGRNKTLQTQATQIQNAISSQNQVVANDTSLLTDEKDMAATAFNEQSSVYQMAQTNYNNSLNAAKSSLNSVISAVGYNGLLQSLQATGGAAAVSNAEQVLGFSPGQLSQIAAIPDPDAQLKAVQLAQAQENLIDTPLKDQAQINASNASAGASAASAALNRNALAYENAHGGLTPAEYTAQQAPIVNQQTVQANTTDLQNYLTSKAGSDGYVSPDSWAKAISAWEEDFAGTGITPPNFVDTFSQFANPKITGQYTTGTALGKK